jgi:hypothetical protein
MSKYLTKKIGSETLNFKFGVRCWRWFAEKYDVALSASFQQFVVQDEKNPNGDINLGPAVDLIYFAAKDAAVSLKKDPDAITVEQVEDWVEDLGFIDFITEAIEFAAERFTDQQNHSSGGTAKKKKSPSAK